MSSRYRICWCSCLALVLLRIAIGWHFLYEGLHKIESHRQGKAPFTAQAYLAHAQGPLRDVIRAQLDDPDGLRLLQADAVSAEWQLMFREMDARYGLTADQKAGVDENILALEEAKDAYFKDEDNQQKIAKFLEQFR